MADFFEAPSTRSASDQRGRLHDALLGQLTPLEVRDIEMLQAFAVPHYRPTKIPPWAMVVGASSVREGTIIREFFKRAFSVPAQNTTVIGCNCWDIQPVPMIQEQYDKLFLGPLFGDARQEYSWMMPQFEGERSSWGFDLAYIRNPDLIDFSNWRVTLNRAIEMVRQGGLVAMVIREADTQKFLRFVDQVKRRSAVTPLLVTETDMCDPKDELRQHFMLALFGGIYRLPESLDEISLPNRY